MNKNDILNAILVGTIIAVMTLVVIFNPFRNVLVSNGCISGECGFEIADASGRDLFLATNQTPDILMFIESTLEWYDDQTKPLSIELDNSSGDIYLVDCKHVNKTSNLCFEIRKEI